MIVSLIAAMDEKGGIGKNKKLPWHLNSDLQRFKKLTMGHYLIMGRKTFEAIGKPLPGRKMIVVTRNKKYYIEGTVLFHSIGEAISYAKKNNEDEVFIIGGGEIFSQCIDLADRIYLTIVHVDSDADVFFTISDKNRWKITWSDESVKSEKDDYMMDFKILTRVH